MGNLLLYDDFAHITTIELSNYRKKVKMRHLVLYRATVIFGLCATILLITACAAPPTSAPPTPVPASPTATLVLPTATEQPATPTPAPPTASRTLAPPSATPSLAPPTQALAKDARGFSILETAHATILTQPGVSNERAHQVEKAFEIAYQVIGADLGYPQKRPRLYVYRSEDELLQDLVAVWGLPEWFKTSRAIPRMNRDAVAWIPPLPRGNGAFIAHEYSHYIIEQIAGADSQFNYKWFDEGLAEYFGLKALAKLTSIDAQTRQQQQTAQVVNAHKAGKLIRFKDITTEEQMVQLIQTGSGVLVYAQSGIALDYLINQHGIAPVKHVLSQIGQRVAFADAFRKAFGFTVDDFETKFFAHIATLQQSPDTCFTIDGQANDWQKLKPLIVDGVYQPIPRAADVRQVYAAICQGALYLMIVTDGPASSGSDIQYAFEVDLTGDDTPEYQPGFDRTRAWIWNLKGTGYADKSNIRFLSEKEFQVAIGTVAEFMIPLSFLENVTSPRIRVYTFAQNQLANRRTAWAKVQP